MPAITASPGFRHLALMSMGLLRMLLSGYAFSLLWVWFAVPILGAGAPTLSFFWAFVIAMTFDFMVGDSSRKIGDEKFWYNITSDVINMVIKTLLVLSVGLVARAII